MIIDLQRRIAQAGRIRIGQQVESSNGRKRPEKLTTFRLTSPNQTRIVQAAKLYGGQPQQWDAPAGKQWEVVTTADSLNVIVPPSDMAFSQHYEMWSAGGCQRRCDGNNESLSQGPCLCDPDARDCDIHTRLSVILRDLPGLGVWRIDTQGYYAAVELQGAVEFIRMAAGTGRMLPAQLRLEQRMMKRNNQTRRFAVPVLDIEASPAQLLDTHTTVMVERDTGRVLDGAFTAIDGSAPLTPVPQTVPEHPIASIAEQASAQQPSRRRTQSVPATGLAPRTVAEAAEDRPDAITKPQLQKLSILRKREGFPDDDEGRAGWFSLVLSLVQREIASNKELTKAEASVIIDVLENTDQATESAVAE